MARNHDRDRVTRVGGPDRTRGGRRQAELGGQPAVRRRRREGDLAQRCPDLLLQGAPGGRERQVEALTVSAEVLVELHRGDVYHASTGLTPRPVRRARAMAWEIEAAQAVGVVGDQQ